MACAISAASGFSAAKSQSKSAIALLPVHRRHPGVQRLALVDAAADALGERLGLRAPHGCFDKRCRRPALLHQLDALDGCEWLECLADTFLGDVVRQVANHYAHRPILRFEL